MGVDWRQFANIGLRVAGIIVPQIGVVESIAKVLPGLHGQQKEDAVVALVQQSLEGAESIVGKELLSDPAVEAATRQFIQGYVAVQNAVAASKAVKPVPSTQGPPPSSPLTLVPLSPGSQTPQ